MLKAALAGVAAVGLWVGAAAAQGQAGTGGLNVDYRSLVSRADLDYDRPATRSEEGMPVGNGRMGSLVWTTPSAMHFQVNRVDVFGEDSSTVSFPKQDSDYASGCGYVDINVSDAGEDVFSGEGFRQHLGVYDAVMSVRGRGVMARVVAWPGRDVFAVEIEDQREKPSAVNVDLRMLRYAIQNITGRNWELTKEHAVEVHTVEQTALSDLDVRENGRIVLTQKFSEHEFYSASAVAIGVVGRAARARYLNESTVQVSAAAAGTGKFAILISSAASMDPKEDVAGTALSELEAGASVGFDGIAKETAEWWHDYWSRGFVHLHSGDGQADFVEANYTYFLYLMGTTSRGGYMPRFGGMLWYTNGDMRRWGSQYWWANQNAYYFNLMAANRLELMGPVWATYSRMLPACALAARQQWGAEGVWIPEITFFNGPEKLPEDVAAELRDLMLARKPYEQRSAKFQWWVETKNRHNARYNFLADGHWEHGHYVVPTKGAGVFGHCTHILCDAGRIGRLCYDRYLYDGDAPWLKEVGYPIIRGAAEFYRTFPNVKKGEDGKYHVLHVNNNESGWDTSDPPMEINGMRTAFETAVWASTALGVDEDVRPKWEEMLENLAPVRSGGRGRRPATPTGGDAGTPGGAATLPVESRQRQATTRGGGSGGEGAYPGLRRFGAFVYGSQGVVRANEPEADLKQRVLEFTSVGSFIDAKGSGGAQIFRNRLRLREGPGAIDAEHIAGLAGGVHAALCDSFPDESGQVVIEVFKRGWPRSWDCAFELLARGGFVVSSAVKDREVRFVNVVSRRGGVCRMRNPWPGAEVSDSRGKTLGGDVLTFETGQGEAVGLVKAGTTAGTIEVPMR